MTHQQPAAAEGTATPLAPGETVEFPPVGLTKEQGAEIIAKLDDIAALLRGLPGEILRSAGFGVAKR